MDVLDVVTGLTATNSRNDKEQILFDAFMSGHREFFVLAKLALDPLISFGVKKVAQISEGEDDASSTFSFDNFLTLAQKLRTRELTGNAARDAIVVAAMRTKVNIWNEVYRRVLLKDLKTGTDVKTVNKILKKIVVVEPSAKDFIIPIFGCQLAHDGMKEANEKHFKGKKLLDTKFDGVRLLTVLDKEAVTVTQFTRNGAVNDNFEAIRKSLETLLPKLPGSIVLDGEIISSSFADLMTQVSRKGNVATDNTRLALFDIIPLSDFREGECKITQQNRHTILTAMETSGLFRESCGSSVYVLPKTLIDLDTAEGQTAFVEFNNLAMKKKAKEIEDTGKSVTEGIMIKDPDAPYVTKRTVAWLKKKPFIEVSLSVVGVTEGEADGKYVGAMGALVCEGEDDGYRISVNVGSGFSDEQRLDLWNRRDQILGMIAEVRADALTLESGSDVYSLRFPRFKGFRGTVPGEKL